MLIPLSLWFLAIAGLKGQETGNHPEWNRWCGKVYEPGYPAFDPGGQTKPPIPVPGPPLLDIQFKPRYSLYLASEETGEFVVNAPLQQFFGQPWPSLTNSTAATTGADQFVFSINVVSTGEPLVENRVTVNTTGNVFGFDLSRLGPASLDPIEVVLYGAPEDGDPTWTATTEVFYLPEKPRGSVTKIDNLHGGMLFRNGRGNGTFEPLLPYGFFASYDGFLRAVVEKNDTAQLKQYADTGLNAMTPLTNYRDAPGLFDILDEIDMRFMFDMREFYKNLTMVEEQVLQARDAEAIFAYWTADEPDGWQDPFPLPSQAYDLTRHLDPYHPIAIVLNCEDYYFAQYSSSSDILMADVYPIGINATFSKWGTPCNATLGDCGCDNCAGSPLDVSRRLDALTDHEWAVNQWPRMKVYNPQAFHGEDYWFRDPSPQESRVLALLAVNHGARGLIAWVYPAPAPTERDLLPGVHGALARVIAASPVVEFLAGGGDGPHRAGVTVPKSATNETGAPPGIDLVDAAYWVLGKQALVSIVNPSYADIEVGPVTVAVPGAVGISSVPLPAEDDVVWKLKACSGSSSSSVLSTPQLPALSVSLLVLDLR